MVAVWPAFSPVMPSGAKLSSELVLILLPTDDDLLLPVLGFLSLLLR